MTATARLSPPFEIVSGRGDSTRQFESVAREMIALAKKCQAQLSDGSDGHPIGRTALAALAKRLYKERQERSRYLPEKLCAEPGWNIMLDLFAATVDGQDVAITAACYGSGVPPTTALRWVEELRAMELIDRMPDPTDHRRTFLRLTAKGYRIMEQYLARLVTSGSRRL